MNQLRLLFITILTGIGTIAFPQYSFNNPDLVPADPMADIGSGYFHAVSAATFSDPQINSYLELRNSVDEGIMEEEYQNRILAFGVSNEELGKMIVIYPNPVVDRFHIKIPGGIGEVESAGIYNMEGDKVRGLKDRIGGKKDVDLEMDANDLVPGLYFLRIDTDFGKISRSFTVKQQDLE